MKKDDLLYIHKGQGVRLNQYGHLLGYLGIEKGFLKVHYSKSGGDCDILIPMENIREDSPISIMKQHYYVDKVSPDELILRRASRREIR